MRTGIGLVRGQRNAQIVCDEYLERLAPLADGLFDVGGLALEWETVDALDGGVVERHGHECGNLPVAQVGQRHVERCECRLACFLCSLSEVNLLLVLAKTVDHVELSVSGSIGRVNDLETGLAADGLAVVGRRLRRAINDGRADGCHLFCFECIQYQLVADTIDITLCDADFNSFHFLLLYYLLHLEFLMYIKLLRACEAWCASSCRAHRRSPRPR